MTKRECAVVSYFKNTVIREDFLSLCENAKDCRMDHGTRQSDPP